jgi:hypothetical protein
MTADKKKVPIESIVLNGVLVANNFGFLPLPPKGDMIALLKELADDGSGKCIFNKVRQRAVAGSALQDKGILKLVKRWVNLLIPATAGPNADGVFIIRSFAALYMEGDSQASHPDKNSSRSKMIRLTFAFNETLKSLRKLSFTNINKPETELFVSFAAFMAASGVAMGNDNYFIQHKIHAHPHTVLTVFVDVRVPDHTMIPALFEHMKTVIPSIVDNEIQT